MDFSWLTQVLAWIVQVNSVISSVTSVLGSLTLLGAGVGFILARIDSGFGPKYNKEARYYRFFRPIAEQLPGRDKYLTARRLGVATTFANYDSTGHLKFRAHFVPDGRFGVYLNLTTRDMRDAKAVWDGLKEHKTVIRTQLDLDKRPGLFSRLSRRGEQVGELEWEPGSRGQYRVTLYYPGRPGELSITASGRKLKRVRRWALTNLVTFQQIFDHLVPEVRKEAKRRQTADASPVPVATVH